MILGNTMRMSLGVCAMVLALSTLNIGTAGAEDKVVCKALLKRFNEYITQRQYRQALSHINSMKYGCTTQHLVKLQKIAMTGYCKSDLLQTQTLIGKGDLKAARSVLKSLERKSCPTDDLNRSLKQKSAALESTKRKQEARQQALRTKHKADAVRLKAKETKRLEKQAHLRAKRDLAAKTEPASMKDFQSLEESVLPVCVSIFSQRKFTRTAETDRCGVALYETCLENAGLSLVPDGEWDGGIYYGLTDSLTSSEQIASQSSLTSKRLSRVAWWLVNQPRVGDTNPRLWSAAHGCVSAFVGRMKTSPFAVIQSKRWQKNGAPEAIAGCLDKCGLDSGDRTQLEKWEAGKGFSARIQRNIEQYKRAVKALTLTSVLDVEDVDPLRTDIVMDIARHAVLLGSQGKILSQKLGVEGEIFDKKYAAFFTSELRDAEKALKTLTRAAKRRKAKIDQLQQSVGRLSDLFDDLSEFGDKYLNRDTKSIFNQIAQLRVLNNGVGQHLAALQQRKKEKEQVEAERLAQNSEIAEEVIGDLCQVTGSIRAIKQEQARQRKVDKRTGLYNPYKRRNNAEALVYSEDRQKKLLRRLKKFKGSFKFKRDCEEDEW